MKVRPLSPCEKGDRRTELVGPRYPLRMEQWTTVDTNVLFFRFREQKIPQHVLAVKALQSRSEVQRIVHVPAPFPSLALIHFPLCILLPHPILYNLGTLGP